jgi:peptidoglycan/LPS O-acetylase OafA/YrhL
MTLHTTNPETSAWTHMPALDGLRGVAVVGVLLFHAGHLSGGFLGVDAFFALSGFLITSLVVREADRTGTVDMIGFWGRRFRRLLPAVVVLLAVTMLWARWFGSAAEWAGVRSDGPWAQAYLANWHQIASSTGYWESFNDPPLLNHLWSLAIEEQFYVVWPLVVALLWKITRRPHAVLLASCLVATAASVAAMMMLYDGGDPTRVYMGTDTRASSILVGAAAATAPAQRLWRWVIDQLGRSVDLVLAGLVGTLAVMWSSIDGASSPGLYRGGLLAHSIVAAVLVALCAQRSHRRLAVQAILSWKPLVLVGALSYSLYLWHWPLYAMLSPQRTGWSGWSLTAVRLAASLAVGLISFHLVEQRVRHRSLWARGSSGRVAFAGSMVALAAFWVITPRPRTEIASFDPSAIVVPATTTSTPPATLPPTQDNPEATPSASTSTTTTTTTVVPRWPELTSITWHGDSIAFDAAPAVIAALEASGVRTDTLAYPGVRLTTYDDGRDALSFIRDRVQVDPPTVMVHQLSVWDAMATVEEQRQAFVAFDDLLAQHGVGLVIVTAPVQTPRLADPAMPLLVDTARWLAARDPSRLVVLDQTPVFGEVYLRDVDGDGIPERKPDGVHLCPSGAARLAVWLLDELTRLSPGLPGASVTQWAAGDWTKEQRFDDPPGACSAL